MTYKKYYDAYIGMIELAAGHVVYSKYRELPLYKKYYYPILITDYYGGWLCSSNLDKWAICQQYFQGTEDSIDNLYEALKPNYVKRSFYKYAYTKTEALETKAVVQTREMIKALDLGEHFDKEAYLSNNEEIIEEGRIFTVLDGDKVTGRALISDVFDGGCNIVVYVYPDYRRQGVGREMVKACINWCLERDLMPIYFSEQSNEASIALAKDLGFDYQNQEIIFHLA